MCQSGQKNENETVWEVHTVALLPESASTLEGGYGYVLQVLGRVFGESVAEREEVDSNSEGGNIKAISLGVKRQLGQPTSS